MTVQINLLPDARLARLKAKRNRQLAGGISTVVVAASLGAVVLLLIITGAQRLRLDALQRSIDERKAEINSVENLREMLTVQKHLAALPGLYDQRVYISRFFDVLSTVSSRDLSLSNVQITADNQVIATGKGRNYAIVAKFVKALESANVHIGQGASKDNQPYFTDVTLDTLTAKEGGTVEFTLNASMSGEVTDGK